MIINGKVIAQQIREKIKEEVETLEFQPGLAVVLVGNNHASKVYVDRKSVVCEDLGFYLEKHELEDNVSEDGLLSLIGKLNENEKIHGILVQLPLPKHISEEKVIEAVNPNKDVDGFNHLSKFVPCTSQGILHLLKEFGIEGKRAVVVGRSIIVGKPTADLLLKENATVTICHSKTKDLASYTKQAEILVVAVGKAHLITADMVKGGAIVIDVGVTRVDGKILGDVDFKNVQEKVAAITPVPGGVGPMTIAMLMKNVLEAAKIRKGVLS